MIKPELDLSKITEFEREQMWSRLCKGSIIQRRIEAALNRRGTYIEIGPDGQYRAVRRVNARRKQS